MRHMRLTTIFLLIGLAAVGTATSQTAPPVGSQGVNPAVLQVNDDVIYAADISLVMRNIAASYTTQGQQPPPEEQLVQMATQRVVEQKLLTQEGRKAGIKPDELAVAEMAQGVEQQAGGIDQLNQSLAAMGTDRNHLLDIVREMDIVRTFIKTRISPTANGVSSRSRWAMPQPSSGMIKNWPATPTATGRGISRTRRKSSKRSVMPMPSMITARPKMIACLSNQVNHVG